MTHTPKHEATDAMGMSERDGGPLSGKSGEAFALLREIFPVEDRATYDGEPDDVERSQWVTNGARRRVAALLATTLTANPSGHSDKCWGRTSYADEVMHCYCPERSATTQPAEQSGALADIASERHRQIEVEGWTPEHDDEHCYGEMAKAAACYAAGQVVSAIPHEIDPDRGATGYRSIWPWDHKWWKPKTYRANLVRAGALIVAEIERLDRKGAAK